MGAVRFDGQASSALQQPKFVLQVLELIRFCERCLHLRDARLVACELCIQPNEILLITRDTYAAAVAELVKALDVKNVVPTAIP